MRWLFLSVVPKPSPRSIEAPHDKKDRSRNDVPDACGQSGIAQKGRAAPVQAKALADYTAALQDLARSASPAVVQIQVRTLAPVEEQDLQKAGFVSQQEATGSGVIVDPEGYIVTNAHVVQNARRIEVKVLTSDENGDEPHGHLVPAKLIGLDKQADIAVVKIEGQNLTALSFLDSDTLQQGQLVLAVGAPSVCRTPSLTAL